MDTAEGGQQAVPAPVDDRDWGHLVGVSIPPLVLSSTEGPVDLAALAADRIVLYVYPRTGRPGEPPTRGWDKVPGALGCTAQSCAFRDSLSDLTAAGAKVVGLSTQPLHEQGGFASATTSPSGSSRTQTFAWLTPSGYRRSSSLASCSTGGRHSSPNTARSSRSSTQSRHRRRTRKRCSHG
jgi:hypothetical protein